MLLTGLLLEARAAYLDPLDLVDENDATLSSGSVAFGNQDQLSDQGLHVIADVPGFGQAGGVTDNQRDVEIGSQRLDQVVFAAPAPLPSQKM